MKRYEYKIHYLKLKGGRSNAPGEQQILEVLNQFGAEGWRLKESSLRSLSPWKGGVNLLLEREIAD